MKTLLPRCLSDRAAASILSGLVAAWVSVAVIRDLALADELAPALAPALALALA